MFRWLLSIEALDKDNQPVTLRFSDGHYIGPNDELFYPRIKQPGLYRFGMYAGDLVSTQLSGFGQTELINSDGKLNYLAEYAIDGRQTRLQRVNNDRTVTDVLTGTAIGFGFQDTTVVVSLREPQEVLNQPHPHNTYSGDNILPDGVEGTQDDIAGSVKPKVFGDVRNAEPVQVNTAKLIFQISDRPECVVDAVYDEGAYIPVEITHTNLESLLSTEPVQGTCSSFQGYIRLGDPPVGVLTVDAHGGSSLAGDVVKEIAGEQGHLVSQESVDRLNLAGPVGIYFTDTQSTSDLINRIINSIGGFWGIDTSNSIVADLIEDPDLTSTPVIEIEDFMNSEVRRNATGVGGNGLPVWKVDVHADYIEKTQDTVAGVVSSGRASRLKKSYRTATAESQTAKNRHLLSESLQIESCLRSVADGQKVADRLMELFSVRRDSVSIDLKIDRALDAPLGSVALVKSSRLGYGEGRKMIVIGREMDAEEGNQTMELWG